MNEFFRIKYKDKKSSMESHISTENQIPFQLIRRQGKMITIRISDDAGVVVAAPKHVPLGTIVGFVDKKSAWIWDQQQKSDDRILLPVFSETEKRIHADSVRAKANRVLENYDGKRPKRVFIRYSKTRWGFMFFFGQYFS